MGRSVGRGLNGLRIVWAIAAKDVVDALKNKTILGLMIGVVMTMLTGRALPILLSLADTRTVVVYDQGRSALVAELQKRDGVRLRRARSREAMEEAIVGSGGPGLGLILPEDLDSSLEGGQTPVLTGAVAHWVSRNDVADLQAFFEGELSELVGRPVRIVIDASRIYPQADGGGFAHMAAIVIVLVITTVGMFLVPQLIMDERQTHTLDALMVSPANAGQVVVGKALAGAFYCLVSAGVALALNHTLIVNWGTAVLATVCGTVFAVAVGLLLGSLFETAQQMGAVAGLLAAALFLPTYLTLATTKLPAIGQVLLSKLPTVALARVFLISLSNSVPAAEVWSNLGIVMVLSVGVLGGVVWKLRRLDR